MYGKSFVKGVGGGGGGRSIFIIRIFPIVCPKLVRAVSPFYTEVVHPLLFVSAVQKCIYCRVRNRHPLNGNKYSVTYNKLSK